MKKLEIEENSLRELLQGKKEYIGGNWCNGVVNIAGGISLFIGIYSAKIPILWINGFLCIIGIILLIMGIGQVRKGSGKRGYNYRKLYEDIKKLSPEESQYSLIAILNTFEGESANKVLLRYFKGGWKTYMFLSYRTAPENDMNNVRSRVAADLKVARSQIEVELLKEELCQPKYSQDLKSTRMYHNRYYRVFIKEFPDRLKRSEFTLDNVKYKWMTLNEMWDNEQIKKNNKDVLDVFERYIFNVNQNLIKENTNQYIGESIYIRLNRICNLSCAFCLAAKSAPGLSLGKLKFVLDKLKVRGIKKIKLTGGEPTLHADFWEVIEYCLKLKMKIVVYSNLYMLSDAFVSKLKKYPVSVETSIHGDELFHNTITGKNAYRKILNNILKLTSANVSVTIHMVVMNKNYMLAEKVIEEAIRVGANKVTFQTLIPREKGKSFFETDENQEIIQEKIKLLYPLKDKYKPKIDISFSDLYEKGCYVVETDGTLYLEKGIDSMTIERLV